MTPSPTSVNGKLPRSVYSRVFLEHRPLWAPVCKSRAVSHPILPYFLLPSPRSQLRVCSPFPCDRQLWAPHPLYLPWTLDDHSSCTLGETPLAITLLQSSHPLLFHLGSPASAVTPYCRDRDTVQQLGGGWRGTELPNFPFLWLPLPLVEPCHTQSLQS